MLESLLEKDLSSNKSQLDIMVVEDKDRANIWRVKQELNSRGFKMMIVGGAVRDTVKNNIKLAKNPQDTTIEKPKDFDLVTDADPNTIRSIFEHADFVSNILHIGESFAIQFLVTKNGRQYEIATYRSDVGGGRRPDSVKFETSPEKDAERRDLTINALFYDIHKLTDSGFLGKIIDYVGGIEDIKNNVINTVGDPYDRFGEDALRKLRAVRFAAKMGSVIPDNVADAIRAGGTSLISADGTMVSSERIKDEFYKGIKSAKSVKYFLNLLKDFDFFKHIFGNTLSVDTSSFIEERHPIVLTANLLKNNSKDTVREDLNKRKYSTPMVDYVNFLISLIGLSENTVSGIKSECARIMLSTQIPKINETSYPMTEDVIYKFASLNNIDKVKIDNMMRLAKEFRSLPVVLMSIGYRGFELGTAISRLEKEFYKNPDRVKKILDSGDKDEINKIIFIGK